MGDPVVAADADAEVEARYHLEQMRQCHIQLQQHLSDVEKLRKASKVLLRLDELPVARGVRSVMRNQITAADSILELAEAHRDNITFFTESVISQEYWTATNADLYAECKGVHASIFSGTSPEPSALSPRIPET